MGWGTSPTPRPPPPPGKTRYPLYRRLGGPQGRSGRAENFVPTGIRSRTIQLVVRRYTDWATRTTKKTKKKYKSFCIQIQRMWNLKCTTIPVKTVATGKVTKSLRKNLDAVPGKHSLSSLEKTAILGTSHIIRKVLQCEAWSLSGGDHRWFKRSTRKKRSVTRDIHIE